MCIKRFVKKIAVVTLAVILCCFDALTVSAAETNVALNKPITAGIYDSTYTKKTFLNDGDEATRVFFGGALTDNADGKVSDHSNAWYQIDLEGRYEIQSIVLKFSEGYTWSTNRNFKITVSNSYDFSDITTAVLGEVGSDEPCSDPYTVSGNGEYYRYIRLERVAGTYSEYGYDGFSELEVFAEEEDAIKESFPSADATNVALNKSVTAGNWSASSHKNNLIDGNQNTTVDEKGTLTDNENSVASDYTKGENWYQIDLGYLYAIECIRLYDNTELWSSGYNISIKLSETTDFDTFTEVYRTAEYEAATFPLEIICNRKYYRYVRIEKINTDMNLEYTFSEFEIWAKESTKIGKKVENVALNKPILAGMWDEYCPKTNLIDGNTSTFVYSGNTRTDNQDNVVSSAGTVWFLIDLEQEYTVSGITLNHYVDKGSEYNFKILASKTPEFDDLSEYDVIADTGLNGKISLPLSVTVDEKTYRYIRLEKYDGSNTAFDYTELEVFGYLPEPALQIGQVQFLSSDDGSGEEILNPLEVSVAGAKVTVKNASTEKKDVMLIVSLYDKKGKMLECSTSEKQLSPGVQRTLTAGVPTEKADEGCWLKAFLWEGNGKIVPLLETKKLNGQTKKNIYVSPEGSDSGKGTFDSPFKTIKRAKEEVKKYNHYMSDTIDVYLREGTYFLDSTLVFDETDSGFNGYSVHYQAYRNEAVTISGGVTVSGWKEYKNGIYQTKVDGIADIRELYADGIKQKRAQSEKQITPLGYYTQNGAVTGFRLPADTKVSAQPERLQLHFDKVFNTYVLNAVTMEKSGSEVIITLQQPQFEESRFSGMQVKSTSPFYLENSLSELDNAGEFYYDINDKVLYYMPEAGKDIHSQEICIPVLEQLLTVKGSSLANKAKNICFSGLTFAHGTYLEPSEIGLMISQAQAKILADERGSSMVNSNITLEACENIVFKENVFTGLAMVGLGLKNGASDNTIEGNVFYDIGDSAVVVGTPADAYMETECNGINLAYGKKTTATSPGSSGAITGSAYSGGWSQEIEHCETCNSCKTEKCVCDKCDYTKGYWQIDLDTPQQIDKIEIDARKNYNQAATRRYFEVLGSNDPNFQEGVRVLGRCNQDMFENEGTWEQNVMSSEKYRYVRVRKTQNEYFYLAEIRLIRFGENFEKHKEVCKNNVINNNYITNVGDYNHSAPGIQAYYTEELQIKNNLIKNVPYSGIALGWGWDTNQNSVTAKNNIIANNEIDNFGRIIIDGGGIYTLGQQPGSKMYGNYIKNQVNECGAIYPDDGSRYWEIYDNVIENADMWMFIWSANKQDINVYRNFTTTPVMINAGVNCTITDTTTFIPGNYPDAVNEIISEAGLTSEYSSIISKVKIGLTYPKDDDIYSNILKSGRELSRIRSYYLESVIQTAESILSLANEEEYPTSAFDNLNSALQTARIGLLICNRESAITLRQKMQAAIAEFCSQKK